MQVYPQFYRNYGVRRMSDLTSPQLALTSELVLPKESVAHHFAYDDLDSGPTPDGAMFKEYPGRVLVQHITELYDPIGGPRPDRSTPENVWIKNYHRRYRSMRPLHDFERSMRDPRTLVTLNYAPLVHLNKYMRSVFSTYYQWNNALKTTLHHLNIALAGNDRQHFIVGEVPRRLPSIAMLKKVSGDYASIPRKILDVVSKPQYQFLVEFWKWLGADRQSSMFSQLNPDNYDRVNIVWMDNGRWIVMNLQTLMAISQADEEDDEGSTKLQRRFLKFLISIVEQRNASSTSDELDKIERETDEDPSNDPGETKGQVKAGNEIDEASIDADIERLDQVDASEEIDETEAVGMDDIPELKSPKESIVDRATLMMEEGTLSPAQHRRLTKIVEKAKAIDNPYGEGTLDEFRQIQPEDLQIQPSEVKIPKMAGVTDESMFESTLNVFDSKYLSNVFDKDITNAAMAIERSGVIVSGYDVEEVETAADHYRIVTMKLTPIDGDASTIRFRVPVVDETGQFKAGNVNYRLRKQRADKPIRKVSSNTVSLTSYYAKVFVERSEKSVVNYPKWLHKQIMTIGLDDSDARIKSLKPVESFVSEIKLPRIYTVLAKRFREITTENDVRIYVDHKRRVEVFGEDVVNSVETEGFVFAGMAGKDPIVVDDNNAFYRVKGNERQVLGQIEDLLQIDATKAPVEIAEFRLFSGNVPVIIALGHRFGLTKLMRILGVRPRRVLSGERMNMETNEYAIKFSDETLIFDRSNVRASMILAGLNRYHKTIARYSVDTFDDPEIYSNVMEENGMRIGFIRELNLAMDMFVDPITEDLLKQMNEPITLAELMIRAVELLMIDYHPDETDMQFMRVRGYERMAGAVYSEMVKSVRKFRSRGVGTAPKVEMNPEAVWMNINTDPSIGQVEESNPIENIKEKELLTYMGTGGRSTQSMVKHTRSFHQSDLGVISEGTTDSNTVAVNAYLSANPQLANLRGLTDLYDPKTTGNSSMISTSAMTAPASDMDDIKRIGFISIQNKHVVAGDGYTAPPLRTGYEKIIAHRADSLFAVAAKDTGTIKEKGDGYVVVQYKDESEERIEIGRRYGNVVGTIVPHDVVCDLNVGDKIKEGDIVAYNSGFFQRDPLDPTQVLMKGGIMAKTAILEQSYTFEDASVISDRVAKQLNTRLTKIQTINVTFDQTIRNLVQVGTDVDVETILCTIEDSVTANNDLFDEDSLDSLKMLSSNTPKSKMSGRVERIEVFYHGDTEDMSESLLSIAKTADKERKKRLKGLGKTATSGQVDGSTRIDKDPLDVDSAAIRIYITGNVGAGVGDKGVFGNQMKSVFSNVMSGINQTESGEDLDALFSYMSISNRIVLSPEVMGTTNTLLRVMSKKVAERYFSKKRGK